MMAARSVIAVTLVVLVGGSARAQLTPAEHACEQEASKQSGTFVAKKIKCLVACDKQALKGKVDVADCLAPFGGTTRDCVSKAEAKLTGGIAKKCALDCPECYADGDCDAAATALAAGIEADIDFVVPVVRCDDAASPDGLTKDEAKARQKVALAVGKFLASTEKCLAKCRKAAAAGKIPATACVYGAETDQKTIDCLIKVAIKALDVVEDPELDAPECLAPDLTFALPIASGFVGDFDAILFCGSPGGAFVD
jgi:hypothetical protein